MPISSSTLARAFDVNSTNMMEAAGNYESSTASKIAKGFIGVFTLGIGYGVIKLIEKFAYIKPKIEEFCDNARGIHEELTTAVANSQDKTTVKLKDGRDITFEQQTRTEMGEEKNTVIISDGKHSEVIDGTLKNICLKLESDFKAAPAHYHIQQDNPPRSLAQKIESLESLESLESGNKQNKLDTLSQNLSRVADYIKRQTGPEGANYRNDLSTSRFKNIPTAASTMVVAPDGIPLAANRIQIGGQNVAIAGQYPKAEHLESYLKTLVANRTPVLVVLASETDIDKGLPPYFSQDGQYGKISVTAKKSSSHQLTDNLKADSYTLTVNGGDKKISIPVVHVPEWKDFGSQGAAELKALVQYVNEVKEKKIAFYEQKGSAAAQDPDKMLPVVHCRAGVGRTGQLLAATELLKPESTLSLESIVSDMRYSRNGSMVQTDAQLKGLAELADKQGKPLLTSDERQSEESIYANV